jgi:hypothetical protein
MCLFAQCYPLQKRPIVPINAAFKIYAVTMVVGREVKYCLLAFGFII